MRLADEQNAPSAAMAGSSDRGLAQGDPPMHGKASIPGESGSRAPAAPSEHTPRAREHDAYGNASPFFEPEPERRTRREDVRVGDGALLSRKTAQSFADFGYSGRRRCRSMSRTTSWGPPSRSRGRERTLRRT